MFNKSLTIFSTPKPFRGRAKITQTNAIRSWVKLLPACEIILFGNDEGTAEIASELKIRHIPEVDCNEHGTPLLSSMFRIAQDVASNQLMCYVNADIILTNDFSLAIRQIQWKSFLLVGQRLDIDLKEPIDFRNLDWEELLRARLTKESQLHGPGALDYFVFPRGMYRDMPPFAVGRPGWDLWMPYWARYIKVPVIDATKAITAVHQNHDYSHHPEGRVGYLEGPEQKRNFELMGGWNCAFGLGHATFLLTPKGLRRALTWDHLYKRFCAIPVLYPNQHFLLSVFRILKKANMLVRKLSER